MNRRALGPANQLRMFEGGELTFDVGFHDARRFALDEASWIELVPGWVSRNELLFESLAALPGWEQRRRSMFTKVVDEPRLTAEFRTLSEAPVPLLRRIGEALSERYGVLYDSAWLNLYRDHRDSTSWHADRPSCQREQCIVPVLSLGETRRFLIRPREGGPSTAFVVRGGDLLTMGGRCQRAFVHSVPKETQPTCARISVNFGSSFQATPD